MPEYWVIDREYPECTRAYNASDEMDAARQWAQDQDPDVYLEGISLLVVNEHNMSTLMVKPSPGFIVSR